MSERIAALDGSERGLLLVGPDPRAVRDVILEKKLGILGWVLVSVMGYKEDTYKVSTQIRRRNADMRFAGSGHMELERYGRL